MFWMMESGQRILVRVEMNCKFVETRSQKEGDFK
jgi:hypothetical protein